MMMEKSSKTKLTQSTLISVALHLAAAVVLFSKPLHIYPRFLTQIGKTPSVFLEEENIVILKRNQALEEAFNQFEQPQNPHLLASHELRALEPDPSLNPEPAPSLLEPVLAIPEFGEPPLADLPTPQVLEDGTFPIPSSSLPAYQPSIVDPFVALPKTENDLSQYAAALPSLESSQEVPSSFYFIPSEENIDIVSVSPLLPPSVSKVEPSLGEPVTLESPIAKVPGAYSDFTLTPDAEKTIAHERHFSSLGEYGLPTIQLKEWNEFFEVDVKTFPKEGGGYLFSIHLIPRQDLSQLRLRQNYLFVIDRSTSVDKHRYQTFKRGVSRAISALREGDYFNVLLLDSNVKKMSERALPFNKSNQQLAESFLEKEAQTRTGAATDVYTALTKMTAMENDSEEAVTAILISDGDSPLKSNQQRKKINQWLEANKGRITLYTAAAGQGNNLSTLKMLGLASRGTLLYSDTHAAFPRKLAKLVMDLRYPIAKEMTVSLLPSDPSAHIELLPPSSRLPYLFSDHPFMLMGSCNKLTDFILVLEGKNKDQLLSIKKSISLSRAKPASRLLMKQWDAEKAHMLFDQYLHEGEASLLEKAGKHVAQNSRR